MINAVDRIINELKFAITKGNGGVLLQLNKEETKTLLKELEQVEPLKRFDSSESLKFLLAKLQAGNRFPICNDINQRYSANGRNCRFIDAGKLIKGKEKVLALVPHGTSEELNANSIRFQNLQGILLHAGYQEDPDSADLKDPHYTLMDPTFGELRLPNGLIQQEMKKADIVLRLNPYGQWVVMKTPNQELDDRYLWVLKVPEVTLDELYHAFAEHLAKIKPDVILHLMSDHPTAENTRNVKPLSPDNDPSQFYTNEIKPMEPSSDKVWSPVDPDTKMNRE